MHTLSLYFALTLVMIATYLILRWSCRGANLLNPLVMQVLRRVSGLVLAALSIQFVLDGLRESRIFVQPLLDLLQQNPS